MNVERLIDRLFQKRVIVNCDRDPYLHRWYLFRSKPLGIFIHKFIRSDEDRALYDHPWNFLVISIWRGYFEHTKRGKNRVWPIIGARLRRGTHQHRVELIRREGINLPSWSLFIRFREFRIWGFWLPEGWMQWNRWWQEKCE